MVLDLGSRQLIVHRTDFALNGGAERSRIGCGLNDPTKREHAIGELGKSVVDLALRNVDDGLIDALQSGFAHVAHHAHDLAGRLFKLRAESLADGHALADGIALGPIFPGKGLIDDGDVL